MFFLLLFSFLLPRSLSFFWRENAPKNFFSITCSRASPLQDFCIIMKSYCTTCEALCTTVRVTSQAAGFAEIRELTSSWHQITNCYRATVVCLDAKGLWKPRESFILAGFTLSLPCSAPCGTGQTTIDIGCDPALPRNCVDHPADCNVFKRYRLIKFVIIRPSTLNHVRNL